MPRKSTKAAAPAAPPEPEPAPAEATEEGGYPRYKSKAPTTTQARFTDWIIEKAEVDTNAFRNKDQAFREGVRLSMALRMQFQASPENQAALAEAKQERLNREVEKAATVPQTPKHIEKGEDPPQRRPVAKKPGARAAARAAAEETVSEPAEKPTRRPIRRAAKPVDDAPF